MDQAAQREFDSLLRAVSAGDPGRVSSHLTHTTLNLDTAIDEDGNTLLHRAAIDPGGPGSAAVIERLIAAGANPNLANLEGYTPAHLAAGNPDSSRVLAMAANGADIHAPDKRGIKPVDIVSSAETAKRMAAAEHAFETRVLMAARPAFDTLVEKSAAAVGVNADTIYGRYSGKIVSVQDGIAVQNIGRQAIRHELKMLDATPRPGQDLRINYQAGIGKVQDRNAEITRGLGR